MNEKVVWIGGYPRTKVNYPEKNIAPLSYEPPKPQPVIQEKPVTSPVTSATVYRYHRYRGPDLRGG